MSICNPLRRILGRRVVRPRFGACARLSRGLFGRAFSFGDAGFRAGHYPVAGYRDRETAAILRSPDPARRGNRPRRGQDVHRQRHLAERFCRRRTEYFRQRRVVHPAQESQRTYWRSGTRNRSHGRRASDPRYGRHCQGRNPHAAVDGRGAGGSHRRSGRSGHDHDGDGPKRRTGPIHAIQPRPGIHRRPDGTKVPAPDASIGPGHGECIRPHGQRRRQSRHK